jgi:cysteine desulfurase/selenocysteine lyase
VPHISNLDGVTNPLQEICKVAHDYGAEVLADSAQSVPHQKTDVNELGCDYLTFSLHKMLGPSGIGILYGREECLVNIDTISGGGKTVAKVGSSVLEFLDGPQKFEGGSSNYAGIAGAKAAVEYLENIDFEWLGDHEKRLNDIITEGVKDLDGVSIIGPDSASLRMGMTAMTVDGIDVHDLAIVLDEAGSIMVRSGFHCVNSWFDAKQIDGGSLRTSTYLYNTEEEARHFVDLFEEAISALG